MENFRLLEAIRIIAAVSGPQGRQMTYGWSYVTDGRAAFSTESTSGKHLCHWTPNWSCQLGAIIRLITGRPWINQD